MTRANPVEDAWLRGLNRDAEATAELSSEFRFLELEAKDYRRAVAEVRHVLTTRLMGERMTESEAFVLGQITGILGRLPSDEGNL